MKIVVKEKVISENYELNENCKFNEGKRFFIGKPTIKENKEVVGYQDICSFEGDLKYNKTFNMWAIPFEGHHKLNISEDKEVNVEKEIFRADLNELHLITSEETVVCSNKENAEEILNELMKEFNKQMIESNEKLLAYCKLHKLDLEETEVDDLFKLVYPNDRYEIVDGELIVVKKVDYSTSYAFCNLYSESNNAYLTDCSNAISTQISTFSK